MKPSRIEVGSNIFIDCGAAIAVGAVPLLDFAVEPGALSVSLDVACPPARTAVRVRDNRSEDPSIAVRAQGAVVTIERGGRVVLQARLLEGGAVVVDELDLSQVGLAISATSAELRLGGAVLAGNTISGAQVGIQLDV